MAFIALRRHVNAAEPKRPVALAAQVDPAAAGRAAKRLAGATSVAAGSASGTTARR